MSKDQPKRHIITSQGLEDFVGRIEAKYQNLADSPWIPDYVAWGNDLCRLTAERDAARVELERLKKYECRTESCNRREFTCDKCGIGLVDNPARRCPVCGTKYGDGESIEDAVRRWRQKPINDEKD
jgi:hypothetical protein